MDKQCVKLFSSLVDICEIADKFKLNGEYQDYQDNTYYFLDGELHSVDNQPAVIHAGGAKEWWNKGIRQPGPCVGSL